MSISSHIFIQEHENESFAELIKSRDSLMREIKCLEKLLLNPDENVDAYDMVLPLALQYKENLECLAELCTYIQCAYDREFKGEEYLFCVDCGGIPMLEPISFEMEEENA